MTTYIERVVTEIVVEPPEAGEGDRADTRWTERSKVEAALKSRARMAERLAAETRDD